MTYAAAHPGTLPLGDSELQAKMKRKFSVTADSTHVRVTCSYTMWGKQAMRYWA